MILTNDDADDEKEDVPRGRRQRISSFFYFFLFVW